MMRVRVRVRARRPCACGCMEGGQGNGGRKGEMQTATRSLVAFGMRWAWARMRE